MDLQTSLHLVIQLKIPTVWLLSQYSLPGLKCSSTFLSIKQWLNFQAHFQGYVTSIFEVNGQNNIILIFHSVLLMSWDLESCLQLYFLLLLSLAISFLELKYVFFFIILNSILNFLRCLSFRLKLSVTLMMLFSPCLELFWVTLIFMLLSLLTGFLGQSTFCLMYSLCSLFCWYVLKCYHEVWIGDIV